MNMNSQTVCSVNASGTFMPQSRSDFENDLSRLHTSKLGKNVTAIPGRVQVDIGLHEGRFGSMKPLRYRDAAQDRGTRVRTSSCAKKGANIYSPPQGEAPGNAKAYGSDDQELINYMLEGQWGKVFRSEKYGLDLGTGLGSQRISEKSINAMFSWGTGLLTGEASRAARTSYAKSVVDLLELETGKRLFQEIIKTCYKNSLTNKNSGKLPKALVFIQDNGETALIHDSRHPYQYELNLEWDSDRETFDWGESVVIAAGSQGLKFVGAAFSPALDLAHELGHFLYALQTPRKPQTSIPNGVKDRAQSDYNGIFGKIFPGGTPVANAGARAGSSDKAEDMFIDCWNHGTFTEAINILPSAQILGNQNFLYSDGMILGEALSTWPDKDPRRPIFFNEQGQRVTLQQNGSNGNPISKESFVRFGHCSFKNFRKQYSMLAIEDQPKFEKLTQDLLNLIKVNGVSLAPQNNNLPEVA